MQYKLFDNNTEKDHSTMCDNIAMFEQEVELNDENLTKTTVKGLNVEEGKLN